MEKNRKQNEEDKAISFQKTPLEEFFLLFLNSTQHNKYIFSLFFCLGIYVISMNNPSFS
jgi:hypothetical protein